MQNTAAARGDDDVLSPVDVVSRRRAVACKRHRGFPQQLAGLLVERAELLVVVRRPDEHQTACCHNRPAVVLAARVLQTLGRELGIFTKGNLPRILTRIQINRVQGSPRRRNGGIPVWIEELVMSGEPVLRVERRRCRAGRSADDRFVALGDVLNDGVDVFGRQRRKRGHAAAAVEDHRAHVGLRHPVGDVNERRDGRRRTGLVCTVARRALRLVQHLAADGRARRRRFGQRVEPHHLVRVHEQQTGLGIERGPAPFRTAVHPRKAHGVFADARRDELPAADHLPELRQHRRVGLRCPCRQKVFGQPLSREGLRLDRERLCLGRVFAGNAAGRNLPVFDRKQRRAVGSIEQKQEALLGGLRHGVDRPAVTLHRDERRRRWKIPVPQVVLDRLEMPDPFARFRVEGEQRIGEEIVAESISADEHVHGVRDRHVHDAALRIQAHACPRRQIAAIGPGVLGPRVVAVFARVRKRVE